MGNNSSTDFVRISRLSGDSRMLFQVLSFGPNFLMRKSYPGFEVWIGAKSGRVFHAEKLRILELHEEAGMLAEAAPDRVAYHLNTARTAILQCWLVLKWSIPSRLSSTLRCTPYLRYIRRRSWIQSLLLLLFFFLTMIINCILRLDHQTFAGL